MSFRPVIQGKTAAILEKEALSYGVTGTTLAMAIVDTVVRENLVHATLAGVDVEQFERPRGCPPSLKFEFRGQLMTVAEIAMAAKLSEEVIRGRLREGWPVDRAASEPVRPYRGTRKGVGQ